MNIDDCMSGAPHVQFILKRVRATRSSVKISKRDSPGPLPGMFCIIYCPQKSAAVPGTAIGCPLRSAHSTHKNIPHICHIIII